MYLSRLRLPCVNAACYWACSYFFIIVIIKRHYSLLIESFNIKEKYEIGASTINYHYQPTQSNVFWVHIIKLVQVKLYLSFFINHFLEPIHKSHCSSFLNICFFSFQFVEKLFPLTLNNQVASNSWSVLVDIGIGKNSFDEGGGVVSFRETSSVPSVYYLYVDLLFVFWHGLHLWRDLAILGSH